MQKKLAHRKLALAASRKGYKVQIVRGASTDNLRLVPAKGETLVTTLALDASRTGYTDASVQEALSDIRKLNCSEEDIHPMSEADLEAIPGIDTLRQFYDVNLYYGVRNPSSITATDSWNDPLPATREKPGRLLAYAYLKPEYVSAAEGFPAHGDVLGITGNGRIGEMRSSRVGRSGMRTGYKVQSGSPTVAEFANKLLELDLDEAKSKQAAQEAREELVEVVDSWAREVYRPYVTYPSIRVTAQKRTNTVKASLAGRLKDPDTDIVAVIEEGARKLESEGLTYQSIDPKGIVTLPMSWGKTGDRYVVTFTY